MDIRHAARSSRTAASSVALDERQRPRRQHGVAVLLQRPPQRVALRFQVVRGFTDVDAAARLRLRQRRRPVVIHLLEQPAQIVGEVVELDQELLFGLGPEDLRQLAHAARVRIDLVELVAEKPLQLGRMLIEGHERLQDLEDACLIAALEPVVLLGGAAELAELPASPLGIDVARRYDGDERGDFAQPIDQDVREVFVAAQLGVPPDVRFAAGELRHPGLEGPLETGDPARLSV